MHSTSSPRTTSVSRARSSLRSHPVLTATIGLVVALLIVAMSLAFVDSRALNADGPLDWDHMKRTEAGFVDEGVLIDFEFDCTTGELRAESPIGGIDVMTVHRRWVEKNSADEVCRRHGFSPEFGGRK